MLDGITNDGGSAAGPLLAFQGSGGAAIALHNFDWGSTPLGPVDGWPQCLRTAVDLMMGSGHAMCLAWGPERTFLYNDAYAPLLGARHPEAMGQAFRTVWSDVWDKIGPLVERTFAGETVTFENLPLVMFRHGDREETWWSFSYSPVRDDAGRILGLLNVTMEATARVRAEQQRDQALQQHELLNAELAHRLKNAMSVIQAIAFQTLGHSGDPVALGKFSERLKALSAAHDVLSQQAWAAAPLEAVAKGVLASFIDNDRLGLSGPDVTIGPRATLSLSLLLHELATNATKYGALSANGGRVELSWKADEDGVADPTFAMCWAERGGPPAEAPTRRGFGSRIIHMGLTGAGGVELNYGADGLTAWMRAPLTDLRQA